MQINLLLLLLLVSFGGGFVPIGDSSSSGTVYSYQSIYFDCTVDPSYERICTNVTYSAAHDAQRQTEQGHVTKIEGCLEEAIHFCLEEEVIKRIEIHI